MFDLAQSETYWLKVEAQFPGEKATMSVAFEVKVRRLPIDEMHEFNKRVRDEGMSDRDIAREVVVDWRGLKNGDEGEAPFTAENFEKLLSLGLGSPIVAAYYSSLPKAKVKN